MVDIVIITVPGTVSRAVPAAPAILKASIVDAGFTCKTIDYSIEFYKNVEEDKIVDLENYFTSSDLNQEMESTAVSMIESWAKEVADLNPKYVGISVFTYQNRRATKLFCEQLRKHSNIKIIIGGQGITDGGILGQQGFARTLLDENLIDYYIKSEGEISLVELLKGNTDYPGINSDNFDQIEDLDSLPIPNYSDYNLSDYNLLALPITFSRGCVRACSFCDIHEHWNKFKFRSGKSVVDEMIKLSQQHGVTTFWFTDSLINGNLKEFKIFCQLLAEYNRTSNTKIFWGGQYIVRGARHLSEQYWQDISESGAIKLAIGVETGSDKVRADMNKGFTNEELDYTMTMVEKYNIPCQFLMLVGYPTETEKDFQDTLDMFDRYKHLNKLIKVQIGGTLAILPGTPLFRQASEFHIDLDSYDNNWIAHDNPTLTINERLNRIKKLRDHIEKLNYPFETDTENFLEMLEKNIPIFEKRNKIKRMIKLKSEQNKN